MVCKSCGWQNDDCANFCVKCGKALTAKSSALCNNAVHSMVTLELYRVHSWVACARDIEYDIGDASGKIKSGTRVELQIPRKQLYLNLCIHPFLGLGEDIEASVLINPPMSATRVRADFSVQADSAIFATTMKIIFTSVDYF